MKSYNKENFKTNFEEILNEASKEIVLLKQYRIPKYAIMSYEQYENLYEKILFLKNTDIDWYSLFLETNNVEKFKSKLKVAEDFFEIIINYICKKECETSLIKLSRKTHIVPSNIIEEFQEDLIDKLYFIFLQKKKINRVSPTETFAVFSNVNIVKDGLCIEFFEPPK